GGLAQWLLVEEQAGRAAGAAADASAQLVELGKTEALGMLDHHDGRLRHVDTDLDHGGGNQKPRVAGREKLHGAILVGALHLAVHEIDGIAEALLEIFETLGRSREVDILGILDQRAYPVGAPAVRERAPDGVDDLVEAAERQCAGIDRLTSSRL